MIHTNAPQEPIKENMPAYENRYNVYKKLYPALKDVYGALKEM